MSALHVSTNLHSAGIEINEQPMNKPALAIVLSIEVLLCGAKVLCAQTPVTHHLVADATLALVEGTQIGKYYALVIGNSNYKDLPQLPGSRKDATELATLLNTKYGFETTLLLDATRLQILDALFRYRILPEDANLLIFYSGQGYVDRQTNLGYWLPVNARADNNENWISNSDVAALIRSLAPRHVLVVSDSCSSGAIVSDKSPAGKAMPESETTTEHASDVRKLQALESRTWMAGACEEPLADNGHQGRSMFTASVLRGLTQMSEPEFSAFDLFSSFVDRKVAGSSLQLPQYASIRGSDDNHGDFIFTRRGRPSSVEGSSSALPGPSSVLPAFQWPPPEASARVSLPQLHLSGSNLPQTFGDIDVMLTSALDFAGYGDKGYYSVPGGFAVAARMEQIYEDGRSMPVPGRFSLSPPVPPIFSLDYLRGLFIARNGYFRVMVFTVTDQPFSQSPKSPTQAEAANWPLGGTNILPIALARKHLPDGFSVTALIYEFKSSSAGDSRQFMLLSPTNHPLNEAILSGTEHLQKSGVWTALGLTPNGRR